MRTLDKIENSFKELVKNYGFDNVTIIMLCQKAQVSRRTFYSNYIDLDDLLEKIFVKEVITTVKGISHLLSGTDITKPIAIEKMYQIFYDDRDFYTPLFLNNETFNSCFIHYITLINLSVLQDAHIDTLEKEYVAHHVAVAELGLIKKWMNDEMKIEPQKLAEFFSKWTFQSCFGNYL